MGHELAKLLSSLYVPAEAFFILLINKLKTGLFNW